MQKYSYDESVDKIASVKSRIEETKNVMIKNIDLVMERGEALHILVGKTEDLQGAAIKFNRKAKDLKWSFFYDNLKLWIIGYRFNFCFPTPPSLLPSTVSFPHFIYSLIEF